MSGCILVTGASGFIGKAFAESIKDKVEVLTPTHAELDLTNYMDVKRYFATHPGIGQVVHCAVAHPRRYEERKSDDEYGQKINADITMAANILRFSDKVIALNTAVKHYYDTDVGWSAELMSSMYSQFNDIIELKLYGVYGPGEECNRFPSYCFKQVCAGAPIEIKRNRPMSWIYIADLCKIIEHFSVLQLCAPSREWDSYEVIMPGARTMCQIAVDCMEVVGTYVGITQTGAGEYYIGDYYKLLREVPDFQFTEWTKGLRELYETNFLPKKQSGATTP